MEMLDHTDGTNKADGVTVSIVTYNTWARTLECVESILAWEATSTTDFEILILDNGTETLPEVVLDDRVEVTKAPNNLGFGRGHNANMRAARLNHFLILNPDTSFTQSTLERLVAALASSRSAIAVAPRLVNPDGSDQESLRRFPTLLTELGRVIGRDRTPGSAFSTLAEVPATSGVSEVEQPAGAAILVRTDVLQELGGFDESFPMYFEDVDLCVRLAGIGKIMLQHDPAVLHDGEGTSSKFRAATTFWIENSRVRYHKKHARGWRRPVAIFLCLLSALTHCVGTLAASVLDSSHGPELRAKSKGYLYSLAAVLYPSDTFWRKKWLR
jgi:N-acetylglucosaminyl-diphospho-decaprenol L-rhamnosyltransferase